METSPVLPTPGLGLVLVEFEYQYEGRDGILVQIRPNERYELLSKTNSHWWQVRTRPGSRAFYIPAKYVRELPQVPALCPALGLPIGPESEAATSPAPTHTNPAPVTVPVLPKSLEEPRKPSDQVLIRLRPEGAYRRPENRLSTFGVPLDFDVSAPPPRTTNGTTNMAASLRVPGDSGPTPIARHQPIPVETPRAPPTHDITQETINHSGRQEAQQEEGHQGQSGAGEEEPEQLPEEPSESEDETGEQQHHPQNQQQHHPPQQNQQQHHPQQQNQQHPQNQHHPHQQNHQQQHHPHPHPQQHHPQHQHHLQQHREEGSSHIYESIQELNIDLDALIGRESERKQEVESETPPPAQESKGDCPVYANVSKIIIPPPPSDPAPQAPGTSLSGSSSSGLSPASPLSPLDKWQAHTDSDSGKLFYFNALTKRSTWTPPPGPGHAPAQLLSEENQNQDQNQSQDQNQNQSQDQNQDQNQDLVDDSVFTTVLNPRAQLEANAELRFSERFCSLRRHGSDVTSKGHAPDQLHDRLKLKRNLSNHSTDPRQPHCHQLEKAGIINKTKVSDHGKKIRKNWSQSWTVLHGGILTFHRDPKSSPAGANSKASQMVPEFTLDLRGASLSWVSHKSSKRNVLELQTRQGSNFLLQNDNDAIAGDWCRVISDAIRQLQQINDTQQQDCDAASDDSDDSDQEQTRRSTSRSSSSDPEQRRVRHKLRRFLQRRPTLQSVKEKGYIRDAVFGCHLDTLCHRENSSVPRFVQKCIRFVDRRGLETDGIYRVSGNLSVIQRLRHKADHEEHLDLEDGSVTEVHVVTGALKLFFRELPEPLFPFSSYDKFIAAIQLPEYSQRASYIKDLVQTLPLPNHSTMETLFRHLQRVVEHREQNRMSCQSLAIVFGPTLLRPQVESNLTVHMVFQSQIVELLLREGPGLFAPPPLV